MQSIRLSSTGTKETKSKSKVASKIVKGIRRSINIILKIRNMFDSYTALKNMVYPRFTYGQLSCITPHKHHFMRMQSLQTSSVRGGLKDVGKYLWRSLHKKNTEIEIYQGIQVPP